MSLCAVIAFRKHFKKRALFVFVLIVAICANIFIPAFEFFVRSEPQNDRILDYISELDWHDSDLLKSKGFDCDGETGTYADDDKFSIHVADATSYDKGYTIKSARIRYIVAWKGENDERETAIILPDVDLKLG